MRRAIACAMWAVLLVLLAMPARGAVAGPVLTRGPYLQRGTESGLVLRWRTSVATDSAVRIGPAPGLLTPFAVEPGSRTEHEVEVSGLSPDTLYYYAVGTSSAVLAGDDAAHAFRTAPPVGTRTPLRIWVLGDAGTADDHAAAVRDAYAELAQEGPTSLWLMLGDNAYDDGTDGEYQDAVFEMYGETLRRSVLWPTLGNHDAHSADSSDESGVYYDVFTLPRQGEAGGVASGTESYYSFDHANVHFVCLNTTDESLSSTGPMLEWLDDDLAATSQDWVVAYFHHPPYTKGSHDSDEEQDLEAVRTNALPILEERGVDLVLAGHSHSYERSSLLDGHYGPSWELTSAMKLDAGDGRIEGTGAYQKATRGPAPHEGTVYMVVGSSGKTSGGELDHPAMPVSLEVLGSAILDIDGDRLDATFLDDEAKVRDHLTVVKHTAVLPVADFDANPRGGLAPLAVSLIDRSSTNTAAWSWDLDGDGDVDSTLPEPTRVYSSPGTYAVKLTAANAAGSDTEHKTGFICVTDVVPGIVALSLHADKATGSWPPVPGAVAYDSLRGGLGPLHGAGGDFAELTLQCLKNDSSQRFFKDPVLPPSGGGFFYLVRAVGTCGVTGTWDSPGARQLAPRDGAIEAAGGCP